MSQVNVVSLGSSPVFGGTIDNNSAQNWLTAYKQAGVYAASLANGEFSVVIHWPDGKVFCAIDPFSIHSLCYRIKDGKLLVAERADDLAGPDAELDPQALYDYLYFT